MSSFISELQAANSQLKQEIRSKNESLKEKSSEIETLKNQLADLETIQTDILKKFDTAESLNNSLYEEIEGFKSNIDKVQGELEQVKADK
jgi:uncharacterized protein involved in exopolysaccharide biosynthesis